MILSILTLPFRILGFAGWFVIQIIRSAGLVILDILLPKDQSTPRVVRLPLGDVGSFRAMMTSIFITITPGTVVLGIVGEDDGVTLLVHTLYYESAEEACEDLSSVDRKMMNAIRIGGRHACH